MAPVASMAANAMSRFNFHGGQIFSCTVLTCDTCSGTGSSAETALFVGGVHHAVCFTVKCYRVGYVS